MKLVQTHKQQSGVVLLVSLLMLLLVTLVGLSVMETSNLEVKMATAKELKTISFQMAEGVLDETLTEPAAISLLGAAYNNFLADPNNPTPVVSTSDYATSSIKGVKDGVSSTLFLGPASTIGYSIRRGSSGLETYYYEAEATANLQKESIVSKHIQGVFVEAPRL